MTLAYVHRTMTGARVTTSLSGIAPDAARTGLIEARGALLVWDVTAGPYPDADIQDPAAAADWLWEIYGPIAASAIFALATGPAAAGTTESVVLPDPLDLPTTVFAAVHQLAHLGWITAWWPSSSTIPPVSQALVRAEAAVLTREVEHLLDDEDATARALTDASSSLTALTVLSEDPQFGARVRLLTDALRTAAEDTGVDLDESTVASTVPADSGWALAAGAVGSGMQPTAAADRLVVANGRVPLPWAAFPTGVVDAEAEGTWQILRDSTRSILQIVVPAAPAVLGPVPEPQLDPPLRARFGPDHLGIELELSRDGKRSFVGAAQVPATALLVSPAARMVRVWCPAASGPPPAADSPDTATVAAVLAHARDRLLGDRVSLAESYAGRQVQNLL